MRKINWSNVTWDTIARALVFLVSMINGAAAILGFTELDIEESTIYTVFTGISMIASAVIGFWKNNSFTEEAQEADKELKKLRKEGIE